MNQVFRGAGSAVNRDSVKLVQQILEEADNFSISSQLKQIQHWQSDRLLTTHQHFYQQKSFRPAMDYFRLQLYCQTNFIERNQELIRVLPLMSKVLPQHMLQMVANAAELQLLTLKLDDRLVQQLSDSDLNAGIPDAAYARAYGETCTLEERAHQIDLIEQLGFELSRLVKKPLISGLLKMAKGPAEVAGFADIHQFLAEGFYAFKKLKKPQMFLTPILTMERTISEFLFSGEDVDHWVQRPELTTQLGAS